MKIPKSFKRFLVGNGIDRETINRRITHPLRVAMGYQGTLPKVLIIGAQKAGTTTLHLELMKHPNIVAPLFKESHFFERPDNQKKGLNWYKAIFPKIIDDRLTIDSTPMMYHESTPELTAKILPNVKLIMLLRDPVNRGFSHYLHNVARNREKLSFAEAIAMEPQRISHTETDLEVESQVTHDYRAFSYVERGKYDVQIERWRQFFPEENLKILIFEEFVSNPEEQINNVYEWLGLKKIEFKLQKVRNQKLINAKLDLGLERELRKKLASSVHRLEKLLGRTLPWNYP